MGVISCDLSNIKAVIFDVDGVLSANTIPMGEDGIPQRTVNIKDGYAIHLACKIGLPIAIISGGNSEAVRNRFMALGMKPENIYLGSSIKMVDYEDFLSRYGFSDEDVIYVGDDIPDIQVMHRCGLACCPKDAAPEVKEVSQYVSPANGGYGVGRDILEQVLKARGQWMADEQAFGW